MHRSPDSRRRMPPSRRVALARSLATTRCAGAVGCAARESDTVPSPAATGTSGVVASAPPRHYRAFVLSESADLVSLVRLDAGGLRVERQTKVGLLPTEIN